MTEYEHEPPFGHAELLSLKVFAQKMEIDLEAAVQELKNQGIEFGSCNDILEDVAKNNGTSPMNIYLLIKKFEPAPKPEKPDTYTPESIEVEFSGTGFGNKTLGAICARFGLDTSLALSRLAKQRVLATTDQTLKSIAEPFNGMLRDELLSREIFHTLTEVEVLLEHWRIYYNRKRLHSALGYRPPAPEAVQPPTSLTSIMTGLT